MILITGATGHIGKELIPLLLETNQSLRVLVRDEKKVAYLNPRIERAIGDRQPAIRLRRVQRQLRMQPLLHELQREQHGAQNQQQADDEDGDDEHVPQGILRRRRRCPRPLSWHSADALSRATGVRDVDVATVPPAGDTGNVAPDGEIQGGARSSARSCTVGG